MGLFGATEVAVLSSLPFMRSSFFKVEGSGAVDWPLDASWLDGESWTVLGGEIGSTLLACGLCGEVDLSLLFPVDRCWLELPVLSLSDTSGMADLLGSRISMTLFWRELNFSDFSWGYQADLHLLLNWLFVTGSSLLYVSCHAFQSRRLVQSMPEKYA